MTNQIILSHCAIAFLLFFRSLFDFYIFLLGNENRPYFQSLLQRPSSSPKTDECVLTLWNHLPLGSVLLVHQSVRLKGGHREVYFPSDVNYFLAPFFQLGRLTRLWSVLCACLFVCLFYGQFWLKTSFSPLQYWNNNVIEHVLWGVDCSLLHDAIYYYWYLFGLPKVAAKCSKYCGHRALIIKWLNSPRPRAWV